MMLKKNKRLMELGVVLLLAVVVFLLYLYYDSLNNKLVNENRLAALVSTSNVTGIDLTLSSIPNVQPVNSDLYGAHAAKLLDSVYGTEDWLKKVKDITQDLSPSFIRYPAGGLSKYGHVWTNFMNQPLTSSEQANLANGNEIRGNGYILADRNNEVSRGNTSELAEITTPLYKYGRLSYIDGVQNKQSRNFIHDFVDIATAARSKALFVANITYGTPNEALQQIDYLNSQGVEVVGVECGNEQYLKANEWFQTGNPQVVAPVSVSNYLDRCDQFKSVIQSSHPGLKIAPTAAPKKSFDEIGPGANTFASFNDVWNTALNTQMTQRGYTDYVMHFYDPFSSCTSVITSGSSKDEIFNCGSAEIANLQKNDVVPDGIVSLPAVLDWYHDNFPNKKLWLTEWNINSSTTSGDFSNTIIHAAFIQDVLNILNDANVKYGDFIKFADYHTLVQDNLVGMIEPRILGNNSNGNISEPDLDGGDFVKRISFLAYKTMKDVFLQKMTPLSVSYTVNNMNPHGLTVHAYLDSANNRAYLITSNLSNNDVPINSIKLGNGSAILNASVDTYFIKGQSLSSSRGANMFSLNDAHDQIEEMSLNNQQLQDVKIPAYSVGYAVVSLNRRPVVEEPVVIYDPSIKIHNSTPWPAQNGRQYVELDSDFDGPSGRINNEKASTLVSQTIPTTAGQTYNLTFYLGGHPGSIPDDTKVAIYIDGSVLDDSFITQPELATSSRVNWVQRNYKFTASDKETTIGFGDIGTPNTIGAFLDNVSVTCLATNTRNSRTNTSNCRPSVQLIKNGSFEAQVVSNAANWDIFPEGNVEGWNVSWQPGSGN